MPFTESTVVEQKLFDGATVAANILNGKKAISTVGAGTARDEQPGRAYDFDGTNDVVEAPAAVATAIQDNEVGTISVWVRRDAQEQTVIFSTSDSDDPNSIISLIQTPAGEFQLLVTETGTDELVVTTAVFELSRWYHVVVTMGTGGVAIYVNGALQDLTFGVGNATTQVWFNTISEIDNVALGALKVSGSYVNHFNGQLFDFKLFDTELTASQVTDIYTFTSSVATRLHYKCDDTHDTVAYDSSGNSYHGTKILIQVANFNYESSDVPYSYQNTVGYSDHYNYMEDASEDLTIGGGGWSFNNVESLATGILDPDGNTNAWHVRKTTTDANAAIVGDTLLPSGQINIIEVWLKEDTVDICDVGLHDGGTFRGFEPELLEGSADISLSTNRLRATNISGWCKVRVKGQISSADTSTKNFFVYPGGPASTTSGDAVFVYHPHVYVSGVGSQQYVHTESGTVVAGNIPRNENSISLDAITGDLNSTLQYAGPVPRNAELTGSFCGQFPNGEVICQTIETGGVLNISGNLSVFIRTTADVSVISANDTLIAKSDEGSPPFQQLAWKFAWESDERLYVKVGTVSGDEEGKWSITDVVDPSSITSAGFTFETGNIEMYIDGLNVPSSLVAGNPLSGTLNDTGNAPVTIGMSLSDGARTHSNEGILYDARIYDTTILTSGEMLYVHSQGESGSDPGTDNLVAHWPMSEGAGFILNDTTSNNNHMIITEQDVTPGGAFWGTLQNEYHYSLNKGFDRAYYNSGTTSLINCGVGTTDDLLISGNLSVSIWARISGSLSVDRSAIAKYVSAGDQRSWSLTPRGGVNDGVIWYASSDGTAANLENAVNTTPLTDGKWHHIVGTVEAGVGQRVYVDTNKFSDLLNGPAQIHTGTANVTIGDGLANYEGWLRDARIYNTLLTDDNVLYLFTDGVSGTVPTSSPVGHWELNQVSGTNVPDISAGGNDGTVEGALANNYNWATEIPAQQDGSSAISQTGAGGLSSPTYSAGLFNGTATNINFIPVASPRSIRVYRGYATVLTTSVIEFPNITGATIDSYTVPDGSTDPEPSIEANRMIFGVNGDLNSVELSDGTALPLYKNAIDSAGTNHGVTSGVTFATYSLETSYGFGESPVGLTKVTALPNESCLQYASTVWTLLVSETVATHSYVFVNIGNSVLRSTFESGNGQFNGFSNVILPMGIHAANFRRHDGDTI